MKVKILSDSTCDLSAQQIQENNIELIPLIVMKNGEEFYDGVTITPAEIFAHVAAGGDLCATAARGVGVYMDAFSKYVNDYDAVIHISLGSSFSSSYQNACLAAAEFENVRVVDSQNLSTGQGLVVLKACQLAKTATDINQLWADTQAFTVNVEASFLVDKLDYLAKGGRCSSAAALGANLLNLKPCIEVKNGKMSVGKKYRGSYAKCLANYVKDRLEGRTDLDKSLLFVTKTEVSEECYATVMDAVKTYSDFETICETTAGCTISCHCGPGTLGVLFVKYDMDAE